MTSTCPGRLVRLTRSARINPYPVESSGNTCSRPSGMSGGSKLTERFATNEMTFDVEGVVNRGMNGQEFLR